MRILAFIRAFLSIPVKVVQRVIVVNRELEEGFAFLNAITPKRQKISSEKKGIPLKNRFRKER